MNNRIGKLLLPIFYSKTASMSELRSLFSVFYPYKIMRAGLDNKHVLMFGVSPFFEEITYDPKTKATQRTKPSFKMVSSVRSLLNLRRLSSKTNEDAYETRQGSATKELDTVEQGGARCFQSGVYYRPHPAISRPTDLHSVREKQSVQRVRQSSLVHDSSRREQ